MNKKFKTWIPDAGGFTYSSNWSHKLITAFPLICVNLVAFFGQLGFAHDHLKSWHLIGQMLFAFGLESIAIFLAFNAYLSEKQNDSALKLKLSSYMFGLLIGYINYSHWANTDKSVAIIVGMFSAISPWLWSIYSKRVSRGILITRGLVDEHSIRLGTTRWLWHPIKCFQLYKWATWMGHNGNPEKVITEWESIRTKKTEIVSIVPSTNGSNTSHEIKVQ